MFKVFVAVLLASVMIAPPVFAQNPYKYKAMGRPMGMPPLGMTPQMTKKKIKKFMESLFEMGVIYRMIGQPTMVPVDNGVIVAYGNKLMKYDKDLNLITEVDLDMNVKSMQYLASKFAKQYSADLMDLMNADTTAGGTTTETMSTGGSTTETMSTGGVLTP
ncbi:MAG: hypothetical protein KGJ09_06730 [Candidatus Omnitrophica bacterium]|nr:hypothetical protein [Candidatus Omnitrophota bacterium]MDE2009759.1 hypothetical protein [Candidatus Omnitrophota bacterium]MDE2213846.1 hypothetical protein [Candidatus Omnitrophota bacterium]MDE2232379.1 hypothetical protein [Candidatus Omnitrophota bacterium]